eukprot:3909278-Amphidinium_carterae.1
MGAAKAGTKGYHKQHNRSQLGTARPSSLGALRSSMTNTVVEFCQWTCQDTTGFLEHPCAR